MQCVRLGLLGLSLAACGGRFDGDAERSGSSPLDGASTREADAAGGSMSGKPSGNTKAPPQASGGNCSITLPESRADYQAPASCGYVESEALGPAGNVDELNQMLIGQWLQCGFPSAWGSEDEVGLEITPQMSWHKLLLDARVTWSPRARSGRTAPCTSWTTAVTCRSISSLRPAP
jgi:hypothetical protein